MGCSPFPESPNDSHRILKSWFQEEDKYHHHVALLICSVHQPFLFPCLPPTCPQANSKNISQLTYLLVTLVSLAEHTLPRFLPGPGLCFYKPLPVLCSPFLFHVYSEVFPPMWALDMRMSGKLGLDYWSNNWGISESHPLGPYSDLEIRVPMFPGWRKSSPM